MIYCLPGMGVNGNMYGGAWRELQNCKFLDWPKYAGETSIEAIAQRIVNTKKIKEGDDLVGTSLGGMVACEICRQVKIRNLILISSALRKEEISLLLTWLHPLAAMVPMALVQELSGRVPGELAQMFAQSEPEFIKAMCKAIFKWRGMHNNTVKVFRIHGKRDNVIPAPKKVDMLLDGGHLIVKTHAQECVNALEGILSLEQGWLGLVRFCSASRSDHRAGQRKR